MMSRLMSYGLARRPQLQASPMTSQSIQIAGVTARRSLSAAALSRSPALARIISRWPQRRTWPLGANSIHNVPAVRHVSFSRMLPKLALKLVRLPAMFGAAMLGAVAYIQYQAVQAGTYAMDIFGKARDAASDAANGVLGGAGDVFAQIGKGWEKTKDEASALEMPEWMRNIYEGKSRQESGGGGGGGNGGPNTPKDSGTGVIGPGAASAAAFALNPEDEEDERPALVAARDDQMMLLTRKMIEIRSLLQTVGHSDSLTLPSIVVVGSQSSGKSSVLEAIVGHEFLPKGSNMVTRRPIELTLVNEPKAHAEWGEFPALGLGKITDFSQIQRTLTDLNLAVPDTDCVSDDPIQLRIHSPNVPDLSLIDLPGYIQVKSVGQPVELEPKIVQLCEKYIQAPNVILAVSAANVDLANSTALRAAMRVDPRGERTIGVVTKMDLVEPDRGAEILSGEHYPLRLGYVGVVCKIPKDNMSLFHRGSNAVTSAIVRNEAAFFGSHPDAFGEQSEVTVGTSNLRKKLMYVLESTMAASLAKTTEAVKHELAEATYEFKVQYNEQPLSAESYLAKSLDAFKHSFKGFTDTFGEQQVRDIIKRELDQQVLDLLAQKYWNPPVKSLGPVDKSIEQEPLESLPKADPDNDLWHTKLNLSVSALTTLGIGRLLTESTADALNTSVQGLVQKSPFSSHSSAVKTITQASEKILHDLSYSTSDELEICLKPYKYRVKVDDAQWRRGRESIAEVLKDELKACEVAIKSVEERNGGRRKTKDVVSFIDRVRNGTTVLEGDGSGGAGGFSSALLEQGREALFLRDRAEILRLRLAAVNSRQCASANNKYYCPEVFLNAVSDRLTTTAGEFLDAELLSKFYDRYPRVLEQRFRQLDDKTVERFAREDPKIRRHIDVVKRKDLLERVLREMEDLQRLEAREVQRHGLRNADDVRDRKKRSWGLF